MSRIDSVVPPEPDTTRRLSWRKEAQCNRAAEPSEGDSSNNQLRTTKGLCIAVLYSITLYLDLMMVS